MVRSVGLSFSLVLTACSLAVGQIPAPSNPVQVPQGPPRPAIIVTPGNSLDSHAPKPPDAQSQPQPDTTPHMKPADLDGRQNLTDGTKMQLIRVMDAEFVHVRKNFPAGEKNMVIAPDGMVKPGDAQLFRMAQTYGAAAKVGDRVQITNIVFKEKSIYFEINGGPKKKTKWYQRISIGGSSGEVPIAPGPDNSMAHGSILTLEFDRPLPEMTVEQVKQLLAPAFDFSSKTATASYADMMPPKVRQAIKSHQALVGMNREMVNIAKGRPDQKVREREGDTEYEEWIYGYPPQEVAFVRFVGDEVVQVKTMTVDGQRIVRTNREVDFPPGQVPGTASAALAQSAEAQGAAAQPAGQTQTPAAPTARPTLRRAGEAAPDQQPADGTIYTEKRLPGSTPSSQPGSDPTSRTPAPQLPGPPLPPPTTLPGGTPPP